MTDASTSTLPATTEEEGELVEYEVFDETFDLVKGINTWNLLLAMDEENPAEFVRSMIHMVSRKDQRRFKNAFASRRNVEMEELAKYFMEMTELVNDRPTEPSSGSKRTSPPKAGSRR